MGSEGVSIKSVLKMHGDIPLVNECLLPKVKDVVDRDYTAVKALYDCQIFSSDRSADEIKKELHKMSELKKQFVYHGTTIRGYPVVIKFDSPESEVIVGERVNHLRQFYPNFMLTYGSFYCAPPLRVDRDVFSPCSGDGSKKRYIALEYVPGFTLSDILDSIDEDTLVNVLIQILYSLHIAKRKIGFIHNDLHISNIILEPGYRVITYGKNILKTNTTAVIVDYGKSHSSRPFNVAFYKGEYMDVYSLVDSIMIPLRGWFQATSLKEKRSIRDIYRDPSYSQRAMIARVIFRMFSSYLLDRSKERMYRFLSSNEPLTVEVHVTYLNVIHNLKKIHKPKWLTQETM